jgi:DNA-binding NarL/FixJ family response regulator
MAVDEVKERPQYEVLVDEALVDWLKIKTLIDAASKYLEGEGDLAMRYVLGVTLFHKRLYHRHLERRFGLQITHTPEGGVLVPEPRAALDGYHRAIYLKDLRALNLWERTFGLIRTILPRVVQHCRECSGCVACNNHKGDPSKLATIAVLEEWSDLPRFDWSNLRCPPIFRDPCLISELRGMSLTSLIAWHILNLSTNPEWRLGKALRALDNSRTPKVVLRERLPAAIMLANDYLPQPTNVLLMRRAVSQAVVSDATLTHGTTTYVKEWEEATQDAEEVGDDPDLRHLVNRAIIQADIAEKVILSSDALELLVLRFQQLGDAAYDRALGQLQTLSPGEVIVFDGKLRGKTEEEIAREGSRARGTVSRQWTRAQEKLHDLFTEPPNNTE